MTPRRPSFDGILTTNIDSSKNWRRMTPPMAATHPKEDRQILIRPTNGIPPTLPSQLQAIIEEMIPDLAPSISVHTPESDGSLRISATSKAAMTALRMLLGISRTLCEPGKILLGTYPLPPLFTC